MNLRRIVMVAVLLAASAALPGCASGSPAAAPATVDQPARVARVQVATVDMSDSWQGATWYDVMTGSHLKGDELNVTTSIYPDDEGKAAAGMLCSMWNVSLNNQAGSWSDDPIVVTVFGQAHSSLSYLNALSMKCT